MIVWDNELRQWIDDATGLAAPVAAIMASRDAMADDYAAAFRQLAILYSSGQITFEQWRTSFDALVIEAVGHGYTLGRGGIDLMSDADWAKVAESVKDQLEYADGFAGDVERSVRDRMATIMEESEQTIDEVQAEQQARAEAEAAVSARSEMYAGASVEAYEEAQAEAHSAGKGVLVLPVYPADHGTECIVSGDSRVITEHGWIAIRDVRVGDRVLTHEGRFRSVTATMVKPSRNKTFVTIKGTSGHTVTFTGDHRLLSSDGWYPLDGIIDRKLPMRVMQPEVMQSAQIINMRLRESERPTGQNVSVVRKPNQGAAAVGITGRTRQDGRFSSECHESSSKDVRGPGRRFDMEPQDGWSSLRSILGGRSEALRLSLSMAMDQGVWSDSGWARDTPQRRRSLERRSRQLGVHSGVISSEDSWTGVLERWAGRAWDSATLEPGSHLRAMWRVVSNRGTQGAAAVLFKCLPHRFGANSVRVRWLREALYRKARAWQAPQVLQQGVLSDDVPLYDITVEGDHSFVIEGVVAHNCRSSCRCAWQIIGDEQAQVWRCTWITAGDQGVCDGCRERGRLYQNLMVPYDGSPPRVE